MLVKIYKVENSVNAMIYIGSTIQLLSKRMSDHCYLANKGRQSKFYTEMRNIGIQNFSITQINELNVIDLDEARREEQMEIIKYDPNILLNEQKAIDLNERRRLTRQIYYLNNKYRLCEYQKRYDREHY